MKRATIKDLAKAAGVSISTVNRVINAAHTVRQPTRELVLQAAESIGFYGLRTVEHSVKQGRETIHLGILLQQPGRAFYKDLGTALNIAANSITHNNIQLTIDFLDDLSPDNVAQGLQRLGKHCDSVALVAAEHPLVSKAIDELLSNGIPVSALIAPLSAQGNVGFIGLDNWKVGRTAAWAFDKISSVPGKIGILVGNHRYRNQELNESGFRSYFREHQRGFTLLEPLSTYESAAVAREKTELLFNQHPDMCGLFISGGGITGAISVIRERNPGEQFVAVGYELFEATRTALIDGILTMVISHPLQLFANETIASMIKAKSITPEAGAQTINLGFEIYTPENI